MIYRKTMVVQDFSWLFTLIQDLQHHPDARVGALVEAALELEKRLEDLEPQMAALAAIRREVAAHQGEIRELVSRMECEGVLDHEHFPLTSEQIARIVRIIGLGDDPST